MQVTEDATNKKMLTIGFRGTEDYRTALKRAAMDRKTNVQAMLEAAVAIYLSAEKGESPVPNPGDNKTQYQDNPGILAQNVTASTQSGDLQYPSDRGALSDIEQLCIERLLRILRSPQPGLPDAIISNLVQFDAFREMYERQAHSDQTERQPPGDAAGIRERDTEVADAAANARRLRERVEDMQRDGSGSQQREARPARTARKRSGT